MQGHISARIMQKKMLDFVCSVLHYPQYSADLAPSDFHLFRSQQNAQKCSREDKLKTLVENLLISKPAEFYLRGIIELPYRWQEVIQTHSEYTID